jgi:predicted  nucleic acid-binding Zn-ribbon protein
MDIREYERLKNKVESAQRNQSQAEGALSQLMETLKKDHGCSTIEEALALSKKLDKDIHKLEKECDEAMEEFNKWEAKL